MEVHSDALRSSSCRLPARVGWSGLGFGAVVYITPWDGQAFRRVAKSSG